MRGPLRVLAVAIGVGLSSASAQTAGDPAGAPAILVIDREAVLLGSRIGQSRLTELAEAEQSLAAENRGIEAELTREEAALAERRGEMDPGAFREEADAFDMRVTAIRETQDAKERVLIERRQRLLDAFRQEMLPVLAEIMEERSATVMLDRDSILIFAASVDITDEVIRRLDTRADGPEEAQGPETPGESPFTAQEVEEEPQAAGD